MGTTNIYLKPKDKTTITYICDTAGEWTWTAPFIFGAGVYTSYTIKVKAISAGGSGGRGASSIGGGGGGGGCYGEMEITVTPGLSYRFFVGAGGAAIDTVVGGVATNGNAGGETKMTRVSPAATIFKLNGGSGGLGTGAGGSGGIPDTANLNAVVTKAFFVGGGNGGKQGKDSKNIPAKELSAGGIGGTVTISTLPNLTYTSSNNSIAEDPHTHTTTIPSTNIINFATNAGGGGGASYLASGGGNNDITTASQSKGGGGGAGYQHGEYPLNQPTDTTANKNWSSGAGGNGYLEFSFELIDISNAGNAPVKAISYTATNTFVYDLYLGGVYK